MNRKELLTENRSAFRFLHEVMQMDFEKPCVVIKGEGRFTYNGVKKAVAAHISGEYAAAVLIKRDRPHMTDRDLYFVRVGAGRFEVEKTYKYKCSRGVGCFWGVGDFEECRKAQTAHYYIVAQSVEHRAELKQDKPRDTAARYKYIPYRYEMCGDGRGKHWVQEVHLMRRDASGEVFTYKPYEGYFTRDEQKAASVWEVVDKSGYMVLERRRDLKRRARKLRADRAAAAARVADFSDRERAIAEKISAARSAIAESVMLCDTYEASDKIEHAAREFRWVLYYMEEHKSRTSAGKYASVESIERALQEIERKIEKVRAELNQ